MFIVDLTGFAPISWPSRTFRDQIKNEMQLVELPAYDSYLAIAEALKSDEETVFGLIRYIQFLSSYNGLSESDATKAAERRFGLRLPR